MPVKVGEEIKNASHHISLSDGRNVVGLLGVDGRGNAQALAIQRAPTPRTALKTSSGSQTYDDFVEPWTPVAQSSWQGGRGNERFETDTTRYADSHAMHTVYASAFLGPQEQITTGYRSELVDLPGNVEWVSMLTGNMQYIATRLDFDSTFTAALLTLLLKRIGTPLVGLSVAVCEDSEGYPGDSVASWTVDTEDITDLESVYLDLEFEEELSITNGDIYWLKIACAGTDEKNCWQVGYAVKNLHTKISSDGSSWASTDVMSLYYRVRDAEQNLQRRFFQYKQAYYMVENQASGAAKVYCNGDRGVADANTDALGTLVDGTKTWRTNQWVGAVAWVIGGTGSTEKKPFRTITSNTGTVLTVDASWEIEHDDTTEYVIVGAEDWTEIDTTGLTGDVTDVLVTGHFVYLCQGDSIEIRKFQWTAASLYEWNDDGTNKASFLTAVRYADGMKVWAGKNNPTPQIELADEVSAWASALSFANTITMNDEFGRINNMLEYGSYRTLYILREGTVMYVGAEGDTYYVYEIPLSEIHQVKHLYNGAACCTNDVYMLFGLGTGGIERWYDGNLDDVGPNRDEGMPEDRQGYVSAMLSYPGRYYAAINAGEGISSVLVSTGSGNWHEVYRGWSAGMQILALGFQVIPGTALDRLWVSVGGDVIWLPFPSGSVNPQSDSAYLYRHEGSITSSYIYCGMFDLVKLYHSMKLHTKNLSDDVCIWMDYRLDEDEEWTTLDEPFTESPVQGLMLADIGGVSGHKLQYRLRFMTNLATISPVLSTAVLDSITRVPVKYSYSMQVRLVDNDATLLDDPDDYSADQKLKLLDNWAETLTPLILRTNHRQFDDAIVFIDPMSLRAFKQVAEGYLGTLVAIEL